MKTWLLLGSSLAISAAALAGCGTSSNGTQPSNASNQKIVLNITALSTSKEVFDQDYGQYLAKKFPNYQINYIPISGTNNLEKMAAKGQSLDLIFESLTGMEDVLKAGLEYDISDLIKKDNIDLSRFEPVTLDAMKNMTGGKLYGLPNQMQVMVLYYNKNIFDKFGVPYPTNGMTWDQVIELSKQLTQMKDGVQYLGLVADTGHTLKLNPFSLPYVDTKTNKSTYDNEKWKTVLSVFQGESQDAGYRSYIQKNKNKIPGLNEFESNTNIAMYTFFTNPATDPAMSKVNWDMVSMPTFSQMPGYGEQTYPDYILIGKSSQNKDAAMEVLKYLTSDEFQMIQSKEGIISPLSSPTVQKALGTGLSSKHNWSAVYYDKFPQTPAKGPYENEAESQLVKLIPQLVTGQMDVNTLMQKAKDAADKAVATAMQSSK